MCCNISQIGLPVVLAGCATPKQFESLDERKYFSEIYYIAVTSSKDTLVSRMKDGRKIKDEAWIEGSVHFNQWLIDNASETSPPMSVIDYSNAGTENAAQVIDAWICERL